MKTFAPDFYKDFRCIAGSCKHSCCIGWEIDIDSETAEYYKSVTGSFGKKLFENVDFSKDGGTFRLCENERCPFLNEKGLCEIIINLGEEALSQVCDDHPRFRNFFESRTEIGLGLCCEAAAKLLLDKKGPVKLEEIDDDGEEEILSDAEEEFFFLREKIFFALQNREKPFETRVFEILDLCGARLCEKDFSKWAKVYKGLERLDESWTKILENMEKSPAPPKDFDENSAEKLLWYFLFRHLSEAPFDGRLAERAAFSVLSFLMTEKAAEQVGIYEAARFYSSEIEYSDENIEILLNSIGEEV